MQVLLAVACAIWIGLISLALVFLVGASASAGWICAAGLGSGLIVWIAVMSWEFRNAIDLREECEAEDCEVSMPDQSQPAFAAFPRIIAREGEAFPDRGIRPSSRRPRRVVLKSGNRRPRQPVLR